MATDLFSQVQEKDLVLTAGQSLALRRAIDAMKADDSIYSACPEVVRTCIAEIVMPSFTSSERQIKALEEQNEASLQLAEKFGARIRDLEAKLSAKRAA